MVEISHAESNTCPVHSCPMYLWRSGDSEGISRDIDYTDSTYIKIRTHKRPDMGMSLAGLVKNIPRPIHPRHRLDLGIC